MNKYVERRVAADSGFQTPQVYLIVYHYTFVHSLLCDPTALGHLLYTNACVWYF